MPNAERITQIHNYYMNIALLTSSLSYCCRLKVGAIAVKDGRIISTGYNGTPSGWDNFCEDDGGSTLPEVLHAESNMIAKLARSNESGKACDIYMSHSPCIHCAKMLYQMEVNAVYFHDFYRSKDGIEFLQKCNIPVTQI